MRYAILILFVSIGSGATVSSYDYLLSQPRPNFAVNHHLPHLTQWGWTINSNTWVELAGHWGYALQMGNASDVDIVGALSDPNSAQSGFVKLATNDPSCYVLMMGINQRYQTPIPNDFYVTNSSGEFVGLYGTNTWTTNGGPMVVSPEGNDTYWSNSAAYWLTQVAAVRSNAPIAIVLNGGEYGLATFFGGASQAWCQDPRVQAATNASPWNTYVGGDGTLGASWLLWFNYGSYRRTHQYQFTTDAVRALLPNRELYVHYETDGESYRSLNANGGTAWATGNHYNGFYTRALSDYPNFEEYYYHYNTGFVGAQDMLTKYLNAVGAHINYGSSSNYSWVCGGYYRTGDSTDFSDIPTYAGFLKCCYTGGMVGAISGYFSSFTDTPFDPASPPHWLLQLTTLAHVHALFSHLDSFLWNGDLLPGPNMHAVSTDQPAYEFPTGDAGTRVLSRKSKAANQWLVTAWAADGNDRNVSVTIPTLGAITVTASSTGSVYRATSGVLQLLDEYSSFQQASIGALNIQNAIFR